MLLKCSFYCILQHKVELVFIWGGFYIVKYNIIGCFRFSWLDFLLLLVWHQEENAYVVFVFFLSLLLCYVFVYHVLLVYLWLNKVLLQHCMWLYLSICCFVYILQCICNWCVWDHDLIIKINGSAQGLTWPY